MTLEDWVDGTFDAAHQRPFGEGVHGHTWKVRIFWPASPPRNAMAVQSMLDEILGTFDHRMLDEIEGLEPSNAGIAKAIAQLMGHLITEVWVWREGRVPCGARLRL